jgi:hypothetical protein
VNQAERVQRAFIAPGLVVTTDSPPGTAAVAHGILVSQFLMLFVRHDEAGKPWDRTPLGFEF